MLRTGTQGERHRGRGGKEREKVELGGIVIEDPNRRERLMLIGPRPHDPAEVKVDSAGR